MPKDPTENIDRYKIRGGHLNEYEFQKNQREFAEQEDENLIPQHGKKPGKVPTPSSRKTGAKKKTK